MPRLRILLPLGTSARFAGPRLDERLAAGEDPFAEAALARRSAELVSRRGRRRIVGGLERVLSDRRTASISAAVPCDWQAVTIARPALEQLAGALRSRGSIQPQGVAVAQVLLSDPSSPLYKPAYPSELYEKARHALLALDPNNEVRGEPRQTGAIA